jgi:hypothetical protein
MTVFSWAKIAFRHPLKAIGFVVLLEGAMTFVSDGWIGLPSLGLLILINGLATDTNLVTISVPISPPSQSPPSSFGF